METYVVRIWRPAETEAAPPASLRGVVQHIGSLEQHAFVDEEQLLVLLRANCPVES